MSPYHYQAAVQDVNRGSRRSPGAAKRRPLTLTNYVPNGTTGSFLGAAAKVLFVLWMIALVAAVFLVPSAQALWVPNTDLVYNLSNTSQMAGPSTYFTDFNRPNPHEFWVELKYGAQNGASCYAGYPQNFILYYCNSTTYDASCVGSGSGSGNYYAYDHYSKMAGMASQPYQGRTYMVIRVTGCHSPGYADADIMGYMSMNYQDIPPSVTFEVSPQAPYQSPQEIEFFPTVTGTITNWVWTYGDGSSYDGTGTPPDTSNVYYSGSYMASLYVENSAGSDTAYYEFDVWPPATPTPIPTITPGPNFTLQTIAPVGTFGAWHRDEMRDDLEVRFGNLTGPYLDMSDQIADGITVLFEMAFSIPNYAIIGLTEIITNVNDLGHQILSSIGTFGNLILQIMRITANTFPSNLQFLVIWVLLLDFVYLIARGET